MNIEVKIQYFIKHKHIYALLKLINASTISRRQEIKQINKVIKTKPVKFILFVEILIEDFNHNMQ